MLNRLIEILKYELSLYQEMLFLLQEEKRLLSDRTRIDELHQLSNRIEALVFKLKGVEGMRTGIITELVESWGMKKHFSFFPDVNLSNMIEAAEGSYKIELKDIQSRLLSVIQSIKELHQENSVIIGCGIENIRTARMFIEELSMPATYRASGKMFAHAAERV